MQEDFTKYADVFFGNGEVDHFPREGIASKWLYIKALCGNTTPHAVLPFGRMSVGAYSSGYPTGYGTHFPNSCGGIRKLFSEMPVRGFSHLHQSGTGAIDYYYNYAIVSPFFGTLANAFSLDAIKDESAEPGRYAVTLREIACRLTVTDRCALHEYVFPREGGRIAVDFSNDGLSKVFDGRYHAPVKDGSVTLPAPGTVLFSGVLSGIRMYFALKFDGCGSPVLFLDGRECESTSLSVESTEQPFGAVLPVTGTRAVVRVAYSTVSADRALADVETCHATFDEASEKAHDIWNEALGRIRIEGTLAQKRKFYSNLYHSLIKPCDLAGEVVNGAADPVTDIGTFWDQYKTALPLIYTVYPAFGKRVAESIVRISRALNHLPGSFGLTSMFPCEAQARMLGIISLCDAYYMGLIDRAAIEECTRRELAREDMRSFLTSGTLERFTHILDASDACADVLAITQDESLKALLSPLPANIRNAYCEDGLLGSASKYYEGDRYTYSFRLHPDMEERIRLAGGKARYSALLDDFFGYGHESVTPVTTLDHPYEKLEELKDRLHVFQGFNNEPDLEAPYNYIFTSEHDKLCEIINAACDEAYTSGRGGLPGNNDSGGLTSCYVWNALGLFPAAGTGRFLLGCPQIEGAELPLPNGRRLCVTVNRPTENARTVAGVSFNGKAVPSYILTTEELLKGGTIAFRMK